ncbi:MAG TPA: asparagine synthase (glutamine-hydrolyzing) [Burkholderiales bacterium]|nr:asparagine synthase (glutamine-hydrolyzing) [Burkholderiales bacterium]
MCGLLGYAMRDGANAPGDVRQALACISHRGPDDQGVWSESATALGFARLSIIDVSPLGHQPMQSPDGRYVIVFNGEIYNFPDLRNKLEAQGERFAGHSDTEILLRLFAREGFEACLTQLRGMFAFAVWDRQQGTLSLARDRLGVKPLVYAQTDRGVLFASEIAALLELDATLSRRPDLEAIDHYLTYQYIPAPLTGFASVRKLPPAHAMVVKGGRVERVFRYWDIDFSKRANLSFEDACAALREQVLEATRIRLVSDVPLGAFLSGGIDSSITVAAMSRLSSSAVKTYAIGFEDERFNELPYARQVAEHLHTDHHEMTVRANAVELLPQLVRHLGEPMADNSLMPTFHVSQFARNEVTVALTGDGGDEVFAGYRRFYHMRRADALRAWKLTPLWKSGRRLTVALENMARPNKRKKVFPATRADEILSMHGAARYKHLLAFYTDAEKAALVTPRLAEAAGKANDAWLEQALARTSGADRLNRWLYLDMCTYLPEDILFKVDIASMANSLECRSPFLDHKLIEFAFSLPGGYKLDAGGRHKRILKEAFKGWLPAGFMERQKKGFSVPLEKWLREDLGELMRDQLLGARALSPWIRQERVETMVQDHLSGRASHSNRLWALLVLSQWIQAFRVPL